MQEELKDLLFGEEDSKKGDYIGKPVSKSSDNFTRSSGNNPRKVMEQLNHFR